MLLSPLPVAEIFWKGQAKAEIIKYFYPASNISVNTQDKQEARLRLLDYE